MKNYLIILLALVLSACRSQKHFTDYDLSYSRSGGLSPVYENLFIKGNSAKFFYEGRGKKYNKTVAISTAEKAALNKTLTENGLKYIQEDDKKLYDNITTTVKMQNGAVIKSDGSMIRADYQQKWDNILAAFEQIISSKNLRN